MNKKLYFVLLSTIFCLTSCSALSISDKTTSFSSSLITETSLEDSSTSQTSDKTSETTSETTSDKTSLSLNVIDDDLFISEVYYDTVYKGAIEISYTSKTPLTGDYNINFYKYDELLLSYNIDNTIFYGGNETHVFLNKDADIALDKAISSTILSTNCIFGRNYITITKNGEIIDAVGGAYTWVEYISSGTFLRFESCFHSRNVYSSLEWYGVRKTDNNLKYLGNLDNIKTQNQMLEGPTINPLYEEYQFADDTSNPLGGFKKVAVDNYVDGDTTWFSGIETSSAKVRYLFINCPEIDHHTGKDNDYDKPWGQPATKFTNEKLKYSKAIRVQSNRNRSLHETYGRYLGYVWYTDDSTLSSSSYKLLNFEIVLNGFSALYTSDIYDTMYDESGILYYDYMKYANDYASSLKLGVFGYRNDPSYDYDNSCTK